MITLSKACKIYEDYAKYTAKVQEREPFPIDMIRETASEWVFYPYAPGFTLGIDVPVVDKFTGEIMSKRMFDYDDAPEVEVPKKYRS